MTEGGHDSVADAAPPSIHAVGGSLGSALALLMLYPLERARVEMQAMTASSSETLSDKTKSLLLQERLGRQPTSRGGAVKVDHSKTMKGPKLEESWEVEDMKVTMTSSSSSDEENFEAPNRKQKKFEEKVGLLTCLLQLRGRGQLYRGVTPVATTMAASNFVFFYMHSFLKQLLLPYGGRNKLHLSLIASSLAGIVNVIMTNPLWVANLRIVTSENGCEEGYNASHPSLWKEMRHIVQTEGWPQLWNGTWASLLLVSNPVIQFFAYEQLKNRLRLLKKQGQKGDLSPLEAFLLGALAKAISTVLTYPLQLTQTVMRIQKQAEKENDSPSAPDIRQHTSTSMHYTSTLDCLIKIYRHKGIEGWFAGMRTKLLQTVLTAAFTFLTYEQIIKALMAAHEAMGRHAYFSGKVERGGNTPVP